MKGNQIFTRMSREHIEIIVKYAHASHMTFSAMVRRLILERLEQLGLVKAADALAINEGESHENE